MPHIGYDQQSICPPAIDLFWFDELLLFIEEGPSGNGLDLSDGFPDSNKQVAFGVTCCVKSLSPGYETVASVDQIDEDSTSGRVATV